MIEIAAGVGAALLVAMLAVAFHDLIRHPGFRRLAMRNLIRRRTESILVIVGSSLGTAIIAAAFLVGATFHSSVRDSARTRLGPVDEEVTLTNLDDLDTATQALTNPPLAGSDGVLPAVRTTAAITITRGATGQDRFTGKSEPAAVVLGVDPVAVNAFGTDPKATGLEDFPKHLGADEVLLNHGVADRLGVGVSQHVTLHVHGNSHDLTVRGILPEVGFGGMADAIVNPDLLRGAAAARMPKAAQPEGVVFVSNGGGVFSGASSSRTLADEIARRLHGHVEAGVATSKSDLLADADERGRSMGQLFTGVGTFSVVAGLLLLVNLFVMMAEERKVELGLARATGLERGHLARVFTLEGLFYAVAAAVLGCALGVGVAAVVVRSASGLVGTGRDLFTLRLVIPAGVLVTAGLIGLGLCMATLWITSSRIARLDIVRALRDLPEPPRHRHELHSSLPAGVGVCVGVALALWGLVGVVPLAAVLGPPIALCSAIPLLKPILGRRVTTVVVSVGTLVWCIGVFTFVPRIVDHTGIPVYVVQSIVMVAAAVGLATALDRVWSVATSLISRTGRGLAARLGLAYPLEKVFRTGMLVGMYALIVFTLTFVSVYAKVSTDQMDTLSRQVAAGADLLVDVNPSNPPSAAHIAAVPGVGGVHAVLRSAPRFTTATGGPATRWATSGFDAAMLAWGVPHLISRAPQFSSDRAVFEALADDPHLIVVDDRFGDTTGLSRSAGGTVGVGETVHARDPISGQTGEYRVAGVFGPDVTETGAWLSAKESKRLSGTGAVASRFVVRAEKGEAPTDLAAALESRLAANGARATTFNTKVTDAMSVEMGFLNLMERYMALGLIVGVAGLAVVMVRAARARRRQIGMLRVLGFSVETVRGAFLVEAAFIAGQGIATGVGLGLLVSYQMLSRSAALGGDVLPYAVPWSTIGLLAVVPFLASLAVALIPASQASSVEPAQVLRLAE